MFWKKIVIILIVSCMLSMEICAAEKGYIGSWLLDKDYSVKYIMEEISFISDFSEEEKATIIFDNFFNRCDNNMNFIPKGTKLIDIILKDGHLKIYVSPEIKLYGGGTAWETSLVKGILNTGFSLNGVNDITLYIDGKIDFLPEGIMLNKFKKEDYIWDK